MNYFIKNLISSIIAGMLIAFGGTVFLCCTLNFTNGKVIGATLFALGLFAIVIYKLNLFTGKVCYVLFENKKFAINLLTILLGNFIGTAVVGYLFRFTATDAFLTLAESVCKAKVENNHLSVFILACFCGIMIYIAVSIFKEAEHEVAKYLGVILPIIVFILCGFEHCVANMYYFSVANYWSLDTIISLFVMILGNTVGGSIFPVLRKLCE